jgi:hypothetical protein
MCLYNTYYVLYKSGAALEPWLGGGQVIILKNLITNRKQQFLQHKNSSCLFLKLAKISIMIYLI